jgi:hypothetical protein
MRYYFDIRDDHYTAEDQEGTELGGNEDGLAGSYQDRDDDCGRRLCCGGVCSNCDSPGFHRAHLRHQYEYDINTLHLRLIRDGAAERWLGTAARTDATSGTLQKLLTIRVRVDPAAPSGSVERYPGVFFLGQTFCYGVHRCRVVAHAAMATINLDALA